MRQGGATVRGSGAVHDVYVRPIHGAGVEGAGFGVWDQGTRQVKNGFVSGVDYHLHFGPASCFLLRFQACAQRGADDTGVIGRNRQKQINDSDYVRRIKKRLVAVHIHDEFAAVRQRLLDLTQPFPAKA